MRRIIVFFIIVSLWGSHVYDAAARAPFAPKEKHKARKKKRVKSEATEQAVQQAATDVTETEQEPAKTKAQLKRERKEQRKKEKEERRKQKRKEKEEKRKEKQEKKERKKHKGEAAPAVKADQPGVIRKWADIEYPQSKRKSHYRIDFLAPLYLDELVRNGYPVKDIPEKALAGLNFYKGVQIAADSLKKAGFDIDIYVHDVASLLESSEMLVRKNAMDSTDLIIGAVDSKDVATLANYAKNRKVNFVSAISSFDAAARENPFFTILEPSMALQCKAIAGNWSARHTRKKALVLYRTFPIYNDNAYKCLAEAAIAQKADYAAVACNTMPVKEALDPYIDSAGENVLAIPVTDLRYSDSLLRTVRRYYPAATFVVYGLPAWAAMAGLQKADAYPKMNILLPATFVFNDKFPAARYIGQVYRREYGGKPQDGVYRGYETLYWYANLLKRYGTIFNKQYADNETAPFTSFEVKPHWDAAGNASYHENQHIYFRSYRNGEVANMDTE
jgi:hypothetical protein